MTFSIADSLLPNWHDMLEANSASWHNLADALLACGEHGRAEIAYRTAAALGHDVSEFCQSLEVAMAAQGVNDGQFPPRRSSFGTAAEQPPGALDIIVLAQLAWQVRVVPDHMILDYLRNCPTRDHALARMIRDPRFERENLSWIHVIRDGDF